MTTLPDTLPGDPGNPRSNSTTVQGHPDGSAMAGTKVISISISTATNGLSSAVDLCGYSVVAIYMPSAWSGSAALTFQAAPTLAGTYQNVYDDAGTEVSIANTVAVASRVLVNKAVLNNLSALRFIKIRSGTAASPVQQVAARTIQLLVKG